MEALKHSAYLNNEWTLDEDSILEELLVKYSSESKIFCYTQIAMQLKDKCIRDVIFRCRWMSLNNLMPEINHIDKKEKLTSCMPKLTHVANRTNDPPNAQVVMPLDGDGEISYQAIGGPSGQLLEQNAHALDQISVNFAAFKIKENVNLLSQAQDNILAVLNNMNDSSEMKMMPPLPVKLNEELVDSIFQRPPSFPDKL